MMSECEHRLFDGKCDLEEENESLARSVNSAADLLHKWASERVRVIRCKDCEYWASTLTPAERDELEKSSFGGDGVCDYWECDGLTATDYCSQAKRRGEKE